MRVHVALRHILIMQQAKGLLERVAVRGEAEVEALCELIVLEAISLHARSTRRLRWYVLRAGDFNERGRHRIAPSPVRNACFPWARRALTSAAQPSGPLGS